MNKATKIFFSSLFGAVLLAGGNVIAQRSDATDIADNTQSKVSKQKSTTSKAKSNADNKASSETKEFNYLPKSSLKGQTLKRMAYTAFYDKDKRIPLWVAWKLTKGHTNGKNKREGMKFMEDEEVPMPRATNTDYVQSGYDRGHMCPSGDNKWSEQAQLESFLYTNCCPQLHSLNAGDWEELESQCRTWAQKYGEIYIVCGPVFLNKKHKTIGRNKVVVPEAFFKVVLCMKGEPKGIGFIYRNTKANQKMFSYVNSIDDIERITGIDFFPALPDKVENAVERMADLSDWL